jgi:uncharacterized membrane protein YkvA (DUF1232 family)
MTARLREWWEGLVDSVQYVAYTRAGVEPNCLPRCSCSDALDYFKHAVHALKREVLVLYYASQEPETGWLPRLLILIAVGYALSPIDLIPDCIPVLGLLDDMILLPLLLWLARRLTPTSVLERARERADNEPLMLPRSIGAAVFVGVTWLAAAEALVTWLAYALSLQQEQRTVCLVAVALVFVVAYSAAVSMYMRPRPPSRIAPVPLPTTTDYVPFDGHL